MAIAILAILSGTGTLLVWWGYAYPEQKIRFTATKRRYRHLFERWGDWAIQAGYPRFTLPWMLLASLLSGLAGGFLVFSSTKLPILAIGISVLLVFAPTIWIRSKSAKRRRQLQKAWPDVVDGIISSVRAGMSLGETLVSAARNAPEEINDILREFITDYRASGLLSHALDNLKVRAADPVADRIVESLRMADQVGGGDLIRLLHDLSAMLREEERTRREVEARQSWTIATARLAAAAPWLVVGLLTLTNPQIAEIYSTTTGSLVLLGGALVTVFAYALMLRLGRLPESRRTLK